MGRTFFQPLYLYQEVLSEYTTWKINNSIFFLDKSVFTCYFTLGTALSREERRDDSLSTCRYALRFFFCAKNARYDSFHRRTVRFIYRKQAYQIP